MCKLKTVRFFLPLFLFLHIDAFSQEGEAFTIKRYSSTNGLPQNSIRSMVMDESRFLWMTTEDGLVRFDGRDFRIYNQSNNPDIHNDRFRVILKTMDGQLLVSELTGATFILKNGEIELAKKGNPQSIVEMNIKGTVPDLAFYLKIQEQLYPGISKEEIGTFPLRILPLPGNQFGIYLNKAMKFRIFEGKEKIMDISTDFSQFLEFFSIGKNVYCFNSNKDLFVLDLKNKRFINAALTGPLTNEKPKTFYLGKNLIWNPAYPDVYLKIANKLYSFNLTSNPLVLQTSLVTSQLPANCLVSDAFYDEKSHSLFIGTDTKGFYIFRKNNLKTIVYNDPKDNQSSAIYSQCDIDSHTVFTAFRREFNHNEGRKSLFQIPNINQECLIKDKENRMYYNIVDTIFYIDLDDNTKGQIVTPGVREYYCFEADGDSILVGNGKGVGYIKNENYYHIYKQPVNSTKLKIEAVKRGPDGNIWIARCKGVARIDSKTGLLSEVEGLGGICSNVLFRDNSKMIIGTYGDGYYVWENGKTFKMPLDKNQNLSHVHSFLIDNNNFLWMSTNKGLFRTRYENILNYISGKQNKIHYEYFGLEDGILNTEFNGGCSPSVIRLKDGYVSYPTMEGTVWLIPEQMPDDQPDEKIIIDEFLIDGHSVTIKDKTEVPAKHETVEIHFATPYWGNISNLNLEYKLEGLNKDWVPIDANAHSLAFSNLTSGTYEFKIRKLRQSDKEDYLQSSITLYVHKKYYETPWFIFLMIIAGGGILYLLIHLNSRRIISENNELEKKITERTIELKNVNLKLKENFSELEEKERFLTESIDVKNRLISIISHDIITPLKFISMVSRISKKNPDLLDRNKLIDSMNDIEYASDKLYNNASNILNWMKFQNNRITPKLDHIALHDFIEEIVEPLKGMAETKELEIKNLVPEEDIIVSDRYIMMIVLQNLLSNAIKYTEKGRIIFNATRKDKHYLITVQDNGIGMNTETKNSIEQIIIRKGQLTGSAPDNENGNQLGYYIIVDFLQLLNGTIKVESTIGAGTIVTISFDDN